MASAIAVKNEDDGFAAEFGPLEWPVSDGLTNSSQPWKIVQRDRSKTLTFTPEFKVQPPEPTPQPETETDPNFPGRGNGIATVIGLPGVDDRETTTSTETMTTTTTLDPNLVTYLDITFSDDRSATITLYPRTETDTVTTITITATPSPSDVIIGTDESTSARTVTGLIAATALLGGLFLIAAVSAVVLWRKVKALERAATVGGDVQVEEKAGASINEVYASETGVREARRGVVERVELSAEGVSTISMPA